MSIKSSMQMLNLGLSIFTKMQTLQQRQIKMARSLSLDNSTHKRKLNTKRNQERTPDYTEAEILDNNEI